MEAVIRRAEEVEPRDQRLPAHVLRGGARVGPRRGGAVRRGRPPAAPARGHPRRRSRTRRRSGPAAHAGVAHPQGRRRRPHGGGAGSRHPRRRDRARPRGDARVLVGRLHALPPLRHHAQPVEHRLQPGWLDGRRRGGARRRVGDARDRSDIGVHPNPRHVQRRRRIQASLWARAGRAAVQPRPLLPRRPAGADGGGLRALQNVIAGPHPSDPVALRPKLRIPPELGGIEGWRIAYSLDLGYRVAPEVRAGSWRPSRDSAKPARSSRRWKSVGRMRT